MKVVFAFATLLALIVVVSCPAADDEKWVTITGQVVLAEGEKIPVPQVIDLRDDPGCKTKEPLIDERFLVNAKNRGIKNAFVWITTVPPVDGRAGPFPQDRIHPKLLKPEPEVVIQMVGCRYEPHAVGARAGQIMVLRNTSRHPHNPNWSSKANPMGSLVFPPGQDLRHEARLVADRLPMEIRCNVHYWMNAWVRVFDHPYFAITDADGKFEIKLAPTGKYHLYIWHEAIGFKDGAKGRNGEPIELKDAKHELGKIAIKETK